MPTRNWSKACHGGQYAKRRSKRLLACVTAERSRLPQELWNAASNVGDDAHKLVNRLLLAARDRASRTQLFESLSPPYPPPLRAREGLSAMDQPDRLRQCSTTSCTASPPR